MNVSDAVLCLNCDELFEGSACPKCAGSTSMPLRSWFKPMSDVGIRVVGDVKVEKKGKAKRQIEQKKSVVDIKRAGKGGIC